MKKRLRHIVEGGESNFFAFPSRGHLTEYNVNARGWGDTSSFISDATGYATQHLQYLAFGETWIDQQSGSFDSRYKFSAKEKDDETSYSYFGARYYDSELSVWLSVDPLSDKYPGLSPYAYCANNPVVLIDPDGMKIKPTNGYTQSSLEKSNSSTVGFLAGCINNGDGTFGTGHAKGMTFEEFSSWANRSSTNELLRNEGLLVKPGDIEDGYNLYNALQSNVVLEVDLLAVSDDRTFNTGAAGSGLGEGATSQTQNGQLENFEDILKRDKVLNRDLANAVFKGEDYNIKNKDSGEIISTEKIRANKKGGTWAFFKNGYFPKESNTIGRILVEDSGDLNSNLSRIGDACSSALK